MGALLPSLPLPQDSVTNKILAVAKIFSRPRSRGFAYSRNIAPARTRNEKQREGAVFLSFVVTNDFVPVGTKSSRPRLATRPAGLITLRLGHVSKNGAQAPFFYHVRPLGLEPRTSQV